jgi:hypothetical protein
MKGDPEQDYFADGMVEDIITALSRYHGLFVIARNSSFAYKGQAVDIKRVGRELGVRYVLEGSVRKIPGQPPAPGPVFAGAPSSSSSLPPWMPPVVTSKQRDRDSQVPDNSNCANLNRL